MRVKMKHWQSRAQTDWLENHTIPWAFSEIAPAMLVLRGFTSASLSSNPNSPEVLCGCFGQQLLAYQTNV